MKHFFDVPVYRLSRDRYYQERDSYVDEVLFPKDSPDSATLRAMDAADPTLNAFMRNHLPRSYGGCWEFNEIVGYIRLHFLGTQVRGEYFAVNKKRLVRTRTKTLEFRTWKLAPEVEIQLPVSRHRILTTVRKYLDDCERELPGRYVDRGPFETLAPHVNWLALFRTR